MKRIKNFYYSDLICPYCGNVFTIQRNKNQKRERFHKKDLYCYICDKTTTHIELRDKGVTEKELEFKNNLNAEEENVYKLIKINKSRRNS